YFLSLINSTQGKMQPTDREIIKNGMQVSWHYEGETIAIELKAPTTGWLAIGFNEKPSLKGTYLVMTRIRNDIPLIEEHYTFDHGDYRSFKSLNLKSNVSAVSGCEIIGKSKIRFSLPVNSDGKFTKLLKKGMKYYLILAFSRSDDFQHHSVMRTTVAVEL
ncbi:MAG: DOMON domain-containing protein, partial [Cyclobacteriaceae bacterium]